MGEHEHESNFTIGGHQIGIDLYSDGATLSKSGPQSANSMRVRFVSISGICHVWHEVGIALTVDIGGQKRTDLEIRRERMVLFQRYLFLVLNDLMSASHDGVIFEGAAIFPRVVVTLADQPQERVFFCLKGADSFADCSLCTIPSRIP